MAYNSFPYTNFHELNLDYLLNKSKEIEGNVQETVDNVLHATQQADRSTQQAVNSQNSATASAQSAAASSQSAVNSANSAAASAQSAEEARAAAGDPKTFTAATQLTDTTKIYVYVGETGTYTYGHYYYYQGGTWHDGGVYGTWATDNALSDSSTNAVQNRVINAAVSELKSDLENYVPYSIGDNIVNAYDTEEIRTDVYVQASNGRVSNNNGWIAIQFPIIGGSVISGRDARNAHIVYMTDRVNNMPTVPTGTIVPGFISGYTSSDAFVNQTVPDNAKYAIISIPSSKQGTLMIAYSAVYPPEYKPYVKGLYYNIILDPPAIPEEPVTVTYNIYVDGSGDFVNLRECLIAITNAGDASESKKYVVQLHPGTHDIISMYDSESDMPANGLFVPPYTKIVGIGDKHNVVISGERTTTSNSWSVLNIRDYANIENLTIKSKNARYTIHDDWQTAINAKSYRHFKDVVFIGENCQYGSVYGSGLKGNSEWMFENCEFDATKAAANGTPGNAFSLHNNNNVTTASFVTFRNCRLINGSSTYKTLRLLSMTTGSANGTVYVTLEGNKVDGIDLRENNASQYGAGCSFWVNGFGNVNTLGVNVSSTDGVDYSDRVDLI